MARRKIDFVIVSSFLFQVRAPLRMRERFIQRC